ncbi:hypothetical protein TNCV_1623651 [Trichonephila clavipes]|nr:hypothetical protein TNCV_1623651 [Trichonephila clavipes]
MLGEMGWFIEFSGSPLYPSKAVISPLTETRFTREQYRMGFDGPSTMTTTPRQASSSELSGQWYPCSWYLCDGLIAISTNYPQGLLWGQIGNSFQPTREEKREYSN